MEFHFTLTRDDLLRFQKLIAQRLRRKTGPFSKVFAAGVVGWMFVGFVIASFFQLRERHPGVGFDLTMLGLCAVLAALALVAAFALKASVLRRDILWPDGAFLSPHTVRVTEAGLRIETARSRAELDWALFREADQDAHNHYLFVDGMQAIIIPKAAVGAHADGFARHLQRIGRGT